MTTLVAFTPSNASTPPFSTSITLDGASYNLQCFWNVYRGGWYYSLIDTSGNTITTAALVGSPPGTNIYLAPGIFTTSTLLYRDGTGNFEITP